MNDMLDEIKITITTKDGNRAIDLKQPFSDIHGIRLMLGEPYLLARLIGDAGRYLEVKGEIERQI